MVMKWYRYVIIIIFGKHIASPGLIHIVEWQELKKKVIVQYVFRENNLNDVTSHKRNADKGISCILTIPDVNRLNSELFWWITNV